MIFSTTVPSPLGTGTTLVEYLSRRFTYHTLDEWQSLVIAGRVSRNGSVAGKSETLVVGDTISYDAGDFDEPPADLSYRIAYEDEWFLGIDKPGDLLVHRAGISFRNNLINHLRHVHVPPFPHAHPVHRLDRETSGALVVAKNTESRAALGREFDNGRVEKLYRAIVRGAPAIGEIDLPIGAAPGSTISYKFGVASDGRSARTRVLESRPLGGGCSLVTLQPITGRTHQIRVHLAAVGSPIVGDKLYGQSEAAYLEWRDDPWQRPEPTFLRFPRQALHCAEVSFMHPYTGKRCRISVEMREDMRELVALLQKHAEDSSFELLLP